MLTFLERMTQLFNVLFPVLAGGVNLNLKKQLNSPHVTLRSAAVSIRNNVIKTLNISDKGCVCVSSSASK